MESYYTNPDSSSLQAGDFNLPATCPCRLRTRRLNHHSGNEDNDEMRFHGSTAIENNKRYNSYITSRQELQVLSKTIVYSTSSLCNCNNRNLLVIASCCASTQNAIIDNKQTYWSATPKKKKKKHDFCVMDYPKLTSLIKPAMMMIRSQMMYSPPPLCRVLL
jgi:hypothetical protein